jgi:UDP-N-acetylmuramate--alanine ligase
VTPIANRVGAGLAQARAARPIRAGERIHVIGAAGAGASAAALLAARAGAAVTACDAGGPSSYTVALERLGIAVEAGHSPSHVTALPHPDRLAVTKALTAIDPDHPELVAARRAEIAVEPWQQVVADAAVGRTLVGVAGTHGKSTTAGWLVHVLTEAGRDPSAFVGALLPSSLTGGAPATGRWGSGPAFVVEADEYAGNFDPYRPMLAILTTADWDHPDVFADRTAVVDAFETWLRRAPDGATLIANVADEGVGAVVERLADWAGSVVAYALADAGPRRPGGRARAMTGRYRTASGPVATLLGRVTAFDRSSTTLEIQGMDRLTRRDRVQLATAGRHNAANALAVAGAALALGLGPEEIAAGLATFGGVGRRLECKGEVAGVTVYDDYAHHPTAIRETLAAVRQREPGRRVWAAVEPLTFHRTAAMLDGLAEALAGADAVAIADIWAGRDPDTTIASPAELADAVSARRPGIPVMAPGSVEATADRLAGEVGAGDVVLVMGGGRSYRIGEILLERLREHR